VTISERVEAGRRERRVLTRVSRAGWRLEQAERERTWALVSARAEGISIRTLATAIGLSPSRVHQLVADANLDVLDAALGDLRAAGWPAPEDPDSGEDAELGGRDTIAGRLSDEVSWLRQCADWLAHLDADSCPPAVSLRPSADWPDRAVVAVDLARVAAVIDRIAADVDELARCSHTCRSLCRSSVWCAWPSRPSVGASVARSPPPVRAGSSIRAGAGDPGRGRQPS
jgi:hypothetical protein